MRNEGFLRFSDQLVMKSYSMKWQRRIGYIHSIFQRIMCELTIRSSCISMKVNRIETQREKEKLCQGSNFIHKVHHSTIDFVYSTQNSFCALDESED